MGGRTPSTKESWYACYTRARHEKRVRAHLDERGFEVFLPLIPRERQWHDRTKVVEFPLFPGYVFARFGTDRLYRILETPGVATVVGFEGELAPIADEEIENIRRFARAVAELGLEPEPEPLVRIERGQHVRITAGPLEDVEGVVVESRSGGERVLVQVGLEAIGQGLKVEVDTRKIEVIE